jgi:hypothetical protein
MHVSVTRTHDPLDQPIELATIAGEEMLPWLREIDGFEGLLMLSDASTGTTRRRDGSSARASPRP